MNNPVFLDLEHNKKRLEYYSQIKTTATKTSKAVEKWIDIYAERVQKLERQVQKAAKLGLKTGLDSRATSSESALRSPIS